MSIQNASLLRFLYSVTSSIRLGQRNEEAWALCFQPIASLYATVSINTVNISGRPFSQPPPYSSPHTPLFLPSSSPSPLPEFCLPSESPSPLEIRLTKPPQYARPRTPTKKINLYIIQTPYNPKHPQNTVYPVKKGDVQAAKDFTENEGLILRKGRFASTLAEFEEIFCMFCLFCST